MGWGGAEGGGEGVQGGAEGGAKVSMTSRSWLPDVRDSRWGDVRGKERSVEGDAGVRTRGDVPFGRRDGIAHRQWLAEQRALPFRRFLPIPCVALASSPFSALQLGYPVGLTVG